MGRKFKRDGNKNKTQDVKGVRGNYHLDEIIKENDMVFDYYKKQGVIHGDEWNDFQSILKTDLPSAFRIQSSLEERDVLDSVLHSKFIDGLKSNPDVTAVPEKLSFVPYAYQMNASRAEVRSVQALKDLHEFLISETEIGNISRQEAVSMVPPLLLDVQPEHLILDACASPGSKTTQIIELMHKDNPNPSGLLVANDINNQRCYLLVHQTLKRLPTANCVVVNQDASEMPAIINEKDEPILYDRILCDVICSGDGTFRKNLELWNSWNPQKGLNLHKIQQNIARRCLELLKVGGLMVYSTCSLNPIEDEAVVAHMLKTYEGAFELVDVSDKLPGLKRSPGLSTWKVFNAEMKEYENMASCNDKFIVPSMFPPSPEVAENLHLDRSFRILPHAQNSGGFYVAVFRKIKEIPISSRATAKYIRPPPQKKRKFNKEDPFVFLDSEVNDLKSTLKEHFGIQDDFPYNNLLVRVANVEKKKGIYYVNDQLRNFLKYNLERFHLVNAGVLLMKKVAKVSPCDYRLSQDGISFISTYINKRQIEVNEDDIARILLGVNDQHYVGFEHLDGKDKFAGLDPGTVVLVVDIRGIKKKICAWMGAQTISAFVSREEKIHLLTLLDKDTTPLRSQAISSRRAKADKGRFQQDIDAEKMIVKYCIVVEEFSPSEEDVEACPVPLESLAIGDILQILSSTEGWYFGIKIGSHECMFSHSCVVPLDLDQTDGLNLDMFLSIHSWNQAITKMFQESVESVNDMSKVMVTYLQSISHNDLKNNIQMLDINSKLGLPFLVSSVTEYDKTDIIDFHKTYDTAQTQTIKQISGVLPSNESNNFNVLVKLKPQFTHNYMITVTLLDGRSTFPLFQSFSCCSDDASSEFIYNRVSTEDYHRRELSFHFQLFDVASKTQPKRFVTSVIKKFPLCTSQTGNLKAEVVFDDITGLIQLDLYYNEFDESAMTLQRLFLTSDDSRNETFVVISLPDSSFRNEDIVVQGELWSNLDEVINEGLVKRSKNGPSAVRQFRTLVPSKCKYDEIVEMSLPDNDNKDIHLRITVYDLHDNIIGLSFLNVIEHGVLLSDGRYELNIYRTELVNELKAHSYLKLPSLKRDVDLSSVHGNYNIIDSTFISCLSCSVSSVLSQNKILMQYLRANDESDLVGITSTLSGANPFDFKYLMPQIMDKTFFLLRSSERVSLMAFDFLTCIFHWYDSELYNHITDAVNDCLANFRHPHADKILLRHLKAKFKSFNDHPEYGHAKLDLIKVCSSIHKLIEFITAARTCGVSGLEGLSEEFEEVMTLALSSVAADNEIWRHIPELARMIDPLLEYEVFDSDVIYEFVEKVLLTLSEERTVVKIGFLGNVLKSKLFKTDCNLGILKTMINYICNVLNSAIKQPKNAELLRLLLSTLYDVLKLIQRFSVFRMEVLTFFINNCFEPIVDLFLLMSATGLQRSFIIYIMAVCDMCNAEIWSIYRQKASDFSTFCNNLLEAFVVICKNNSIPASWTLLVSQMYVIMMGSVMAIQNIAIRQGITILDSSNMLQLLNHVKSHLDSDASHSSLLLQRFTTVFQDYVSTVDFHQQLNLVVSFGEASNPYFRNTLISFMKSTRFVEAMDTVFMCFWELPTSESHMDLVQELCNHAYHTSSLEHKTMEVFSLLVAALIQYKKYKKLDEGWMYTLISLSQIRSFASQRGLHKSWATVVKESHDILIYNQNLNEAGKLLEYATEEIQWCNSKLSEKHQQLQIAFGTTTSSQKELKETFFLKAVEYFEAEELYELSIRLHKELLAVYESVFYEYDRVAELMTKLSTLYGNVAKKQRMEYHFFLVGFYGIGHPEPLRNRSFIMKGEKLELWDQFRQNILHTMGGEYLDIMKQIEAGFVLNPPRLNSRHIAVIPLNPVISSMEYNQELAKNPLLAWYYKHNDLAIFELHRPFQLKQSEFTTLEVSETNSTWIKPFRFSIYNTLPGILPFGQLATFTVLNHMNPIQVACYNLKEMNNKLFYYTEMLKKQFKEFEMALHGQVRGILQADVGGGVQNYLKFFDQINAEEHTTELNDLLTTICQHLSILEESVDVCRRNSPESTFVQFIVESFNTYKAKLADHISQAQSNITSKYPPLPARTSALHSNKLRVK
ncbi:unnamed protein product [Bursaphelenchus okinawaensis]|uniref:tRNA (cytosine(34)-C(5))-methyltransferase n=1 Tax=Bursaphelenchus okinawaensis TaxID=465554 RepID=A0A811JTW4_9BILA|nr:unnamed protein product [Bursaphelenchus okinawaensis]CAG9082747.1 unnamed protein product [Bursaphelenchus okinawaensis]